MKIYELAFLWMGFCSEGLFSYESDFVFPSKKAIYDEIWWCIEHLESQIKWDFLNNIKERRGMLSSTKKNISPVDIKSFAIWQKFRWTSLHIDEDVWMGVHKIR